jgi:hypothetical protein
MGVPRRGSRAVLALGALLGCGSGVAQGGRAEVNVSTAARVDDFVLVVGGTITEASGNHRPFVSANELRTGDTFYLTARTTQSASVYVAFCTAQHKLEVYPTTGDTPVGPDNEVTLPKTGHFRVEPPAGVETLYVIASRDHLDLADPRLAAKLHEAQGDGAKQPCAPELAMTTDESRSESRGAAQPLRDASSDPSSQLVSRGISVEESSAETVSVRSDPYHIAILAFRRAHL